MFRNYFKTALRNFRRHTLFTFINVTGLTIGFTACLLIGLFISDEMSFDRFHKKADRIVRLTMDYQMSGTPEKLAVTGSKPGPQFARMFPEIDAFCRISPGSRDLKIGQNVFKEPAFLYADSSFFKVFSFPLIKGNPEQALDQLNKVVITESSAKKYFGEKDPVGQTIESGQQLMTVSAVCKDVPENSQIQFDFVAPFASLGEIAQQEQWYTANWFTYLLVDNKEDIGPLERKIQTYMQTPEIRKELDLEGNDYLTYHLQPLLSIHLGSDASNDFPTNGNMKFVYMLAVVSLLIFLIAFANYTNLTISQSTTRIGEIGMRKVLGARKQQIFFQFVSEACLISIASLLIAWIAAGALLPAFNNLTGKNFTVLSLLSGKMIALAIVAAIVFGIIAGMYPAMIVSSRKTIHILKKGFTFNSGNPLLRKGLVIAQFAVSVFLIIYTLTILQQMNYLQDKDLGYSRENVMVISAKGTDRELMRNALQRTPGVISVTSGYDTPADIQWGDGITVFTDGGKHSISLNAQPVGLDYIKTLDIHLAAGRDFTKSDFGMMDTTDNYSHYRQPYIINETLAKMIGWKPEEAIGKTISKGVDGPIVGVIKDFNYQSLHQPVGPLLLMLSDNMLNVFLVRVSGNPSGVIQSLQDLWKQRVPEYAFSYNFLDEDYDNLYRTETRSSNFLLVAASLGILLACLGLFGLAAFTMARRRKEIGIRKVLGADERSIIVTVSKGFLQLIAIAIAIAVPVAWFAGNSWLDHFAYRIAMSVTIIFVTALATILLAFVTMSVQALQTARINPAKILKEE